MRTGKTRWAVYKMCCTYETYEGYWQARNEQGLQRKDKYLFLRNLPRIIKITLKMHYAFAQSKQKFKGRVATLDRPNGNLAPTEL